MSRSIFGWDLPPGCTHQQIDEYFGGDDVDHYTKSLECVEATEECARDEKRQELLMQALIHAILYVGDTVREVYEK